MSLVAGGGVVVASRGVAVSDGELWFFFGGVGEIPRSNQDPCQGLAHCSVNPCHTPAVGDCQGMG
jgi:hypothetical protein